MATQLVWFKRDLRVADHRPLAQAARSGKCICLFVYEPDLIEAADFDEAHLNFINQSLLDLKQSLEKIGGQLTLRCGRMPEVLDEIMATHPFERIWSHEETTNFVSYQRDRRVRAWAKSKGVRFTEIPQYGVVRRLKSRDGWSSIWQKRIKEPVTPSPASINCATGVQSRGILESDEFELNSFGRSGLQTGGEQQALDCLATFLDHRGVNYRKEMSSPVTAFNSCSRLSPYLAYGNVSIRTVHNAAAARSKELRERKKAGDKIETTWLQSLSSFQSRIRWHCHFMQKIEDEPEIEFENINRAFDGLREDEFNESYFDAWCHGQTGYPMVDACMRALRTTGWINFRMRSMPVSFAAYHLWLHWRRPAVFMARLFLDYEPGIHYSQFQMQSGVTGINTVRIYSPVKQVADQVPHGRFIRRFIPELDGVPDKHLAEPHKMNLMEQSLFGCRIGSDYPAPIVDHKTRYRIARDRIHAARKCEAVRQESARVYLKHGSRKASRLRQ